MTEVHSGPTHLLIGVCGSVHAVYLPTYLHLIRQRFHVTVSAVVTKAAEGFVVPTALDCCCGEGFAVSGPDRAQADGTPLHISLARWADVVLVLPATANSLSKLAVGASDDLYSTTLTAFDGPTFIAPAMSASMWACRAVQRNVQRVVQDGRRLIAPTGCPAVADPSGDLVGVSPSYNSVLSNLASTLPARVPRGGASPHTDPRLPESVTISPGDSS